MRVDNADRKSVIQREYADARPTHARKTERKAVKLAGHRKSFFNRSLMLVADKLMLAADCSDSPEMINRTEGNVCFRLYCSSD